MKLLKTIVTSISIGLLCLGCGTKISPRINSVLPQSIAVGTQSVTLKVSGFNFTDQTVIIWNGNKLPTSALSAGTLTAPLGSGNVATPSIVKVQVQDTPDGEASLPMLVVIAPSSLAISTTSLPAATQNTPYTTTLSTYGGTCACTWSITSGSLPSGLSLASSTGIISGTPSQSGSFSVGLTVQDSSTPAQTAAASFTFTVSAPPAISATQLAISPASFPEVVANQRYETSLIASGGVSAYTWSITSGALPTGLALSPSSGIISGTPTTTGQFNFTATVTDSGSPLQTSSIATSITITAAPVSLTITSSTLPVGTQGSSYSTSLQATGGAPAYSWSITSGSLPSGLTLAATTGIISGTPTSTGKTSFTATVSDTASPANATSASISMTINAASITTSPGTTWYIRPDGGTRYSTNKTQGQCDGRSDTAYTGTGTNQHCAFSDYRYLWDDQSYNSDAWVIAGGDTVIVRGGPWRIGWDSNTGLGAGYTWCLGGAGCQNPPIPAGTPTQHTRILGENYAGCSTGTTTDRTKLTQIFGGFGIVTPLDLSGAQYVDVECIDVTRHSDCITFGSPASPSSCQTSAPVDDYDSDGIHTDVNTHDLLLQDMWIHGHTGRGIKGPFGGLVTCLRCNISFNGAAGWDMDDGNATKFVNATWVFNYSTIEWNGCNQQYPAVNPIPVDSCYSQSTGGYGDGVGTPSGTGLNVSVDHSIFRYNTQDALDLGHVDTGGPYTLSITNSTAYSNNGGTFKWGGNFGTVTITNNVAIADCQRMAYPIPGTPSTYNANLSDFCRAQDAVPFDFRQNTYTLFANNTIVTYAPTTFDIACWDSPGFGGNNNGCGQAILNMYDNIVIGYDNPVTYNGGGQPGGPGLFYFQSPIGTINRRNNIFYGIGHGFACPTGYTGEECVSPGLVNQPTGNGSTFVQSELDNYNFNLAPGTPAAGTGITYTGVPALDYNGAQRPNPPSIGAVEE